MSSPIATLPANVIANANEPRWKKPWNDKKTGKPKGGMWRLFHGGKYVTLTTYGSPTTCTGKRGTKAERNQATEARNRYLAEHHANQQATARADSVDDEIELRVVDVVRPYLEKHLPTLGERSAKNMRLPIMDFLCGRDVETKGVLPCRGFGKMPFADLDDEHFEAWSEAHPNWSDSGHANAMKALIAAFNFAMTAAGGRVIDRHPLQGVKLASSGIRKSYLRMGEENILRRYMSKSLRPIVDAILAHGTRPSELAKATTAHVVKSRDGGLMIVLDAHEWKNGKKKGKRYIHLLPEYAAHVARVMDRAERLGEVLPLWVNSVGGRWTASNIRKAFVAVVDRAIKAGHQITPDLTPYSLRHTMIRRALIAGQSIKSIADYCGTSTRMIERTYGDLTTEADVMRGVALAAAGC